MHSHDDTSTTCTAVVSHVIILNDSKRVPIKMTRAPLNELVSSKLISQLELFYNLLVLI